MNWKKRILDQIWLIVYPTEERGVVRREILRVLILKQDFWLANKWQSFAIFSNLKKEMTSTTYLPILYIIHVILGYEVSIKNSNVFTFSRRTPSLP